MILYLVDQRLAISFPIRIIDSNKILYKQVSAVTLPTTISIPNRVFIYSIINKQYKLYLLLPNEYVISQSALTINYHFYCLLCKNCSMILCTLNFLVFCFLLLS